MPQQDETTPEAITGGAGVRAGVDGDLAAAVGNGVAVGVEITGVDVAGGRFTGARVADGVASPIVGDGSRATIGFAARPFERDQGAVQAAQTQSAARQPSTRTQRPFS